MRSTDAGGGGSDECLIGPDYDLMLTASVCFSLFCVPLQRILSLFRLDSPRPRPTTPASSTLLSPSLNPHPSPPSLAPSSSAASTTVLLLVPIVGPALRWVSCQRRKREGDSQTDRQRLICQHVQGESVVGSSLSEAGPGAGLASLAVDSVTRWIGSASGSAADLPCLCVLSWITTIRGLHTPRVSSSTFGRRSVASALRALTLSQISRSVSLISCSPPTPLPSWPVSLLLADHWSATLAWAALPQSDLTRIRVDLKDVPSVDRPSPGGPCCHLGLGEVRRRTTQDHLGWSVQSSRFLPFFSLVSTGWSGRTHADPLVLGRSSDAHRSVYAEQGHSSPREEQTGRVDGRWCCARRSRSAIDAVSLPPRPESALCGRVSRVERAELG